MNLRPEMKVAACLRFSIGSRLPHEAQAKVGGHSGGLRMAKVPCWRSSLHQRQEDSEGTRSEVYQMDDVAGWTCVVSLYVRHKNICKSQRTVMSP
jgi:hypothetical protein